MDNYIGRYLNTYNVNRSGMLYKDARPTVDIKLNYQISKNFDFYIDAWNVLAQAERQLSYYADRPNRLDKMHVFRDQGTALAPRPGNAAGWRYTVALGERLPARWAGSPARRARLAAGTRDALAICG